jgi:molecular chaperone GrpE
MSETSESNKPAGEAEPQSSESAVESTESPKGSQAEHAAEAPAAEAAPEPSPLEKAQAEINKLKDSWIRTAADFDNFRKRARKEVEDARKQGGEELLRELLPVFDNLERGIQSAQRAQDVKAVAEGLTMVHKQFDNTLSRMGITKVPTVGHPFDPTVHEAIQQVETDEHPPGTIVSEVQAGYLNGERLVRAAMVVVAKAKAAGADGDKGESN